MISRNLHQSVDFSYSIVITCFNAESTIQRSIESASKQVISPKEIIVIDDCSEDNSFKVIQGLSKDVANLKIIRNTTNMGVSVSRNIAILQTTSPFIMIMDDDDVSRPDRILYHKENFLSGADLSYVSSKKIYSTNYSKSFLNKSYFGCLDSRKLLKYVNGLTDSNINNLYLPASTIGFKKNLWVELKGFDETFRRLEDIDFAFRASVIDSLFAFSDKILVTRYHSKGSDKSSDTDQFYLTKFLDKHMDLLDLNDYNRIQYWLKLRSLYFKGEVLNMLKIVLKYFFLYPKDTFRFLRVVKRLIHDIKISKIAT